MNAEAVYKSAQNGGVRLRLPEAGKPVIQIGSSIYSGDWAQTIGTDMIFSIPQNVPETELKKDSGSENSPMLDLFATSDTRLDARKALLINAATDRNKDVGENDLQLNPIQTYAVEESIKKGDLNN